VATKFHHVQFFHLAITTQLDCLSPCSSKATSCRTKLEHAKADQNPQEFKSSMHRQFRTAHEGHKPHAGLDPSRASTGVVWTTEQAYEHGYLEDPHSWANLGQGAPEVDDDIKGCFDRPTHIDITMTGREYGPTAGIKPLRDAVANLYNAHHREGKESKYTWENVCIVPGGRAGLIRIAAVLGKPLVEI
jgi:aspartate/methionine/tyrosine aminotransferase